MKNEELLHNHVESVALGLDCQVRQQLQVSEVSALLPAKQ